VWLPSGFIRVNAVKNIEKAHIAKSLRECIGYVLKDCEETGFSLAAIHLKIAMEESDASASLLEQSATTDASERRAV